PTLVADVLRHVKVRRQQALQDIVHVSRRLAHEFDATVAVMVGREPAEALVTHLQTQVLADGLRFAFREALDDLRNAFALLLSIWRLARRRLRALALRGGRSRRRNVVESHQVHVRAVAMLRDLQQVDDAVEARLPRQLRRDVRHLDLLDRVDFDLPHCGAAVALARLDARRLPDANAASNLAAPDAGTQTLGEVHGPDSRPP